MPTTTTTVTRLNELTREQAAACADHPNPELFFSMSEEKGHGGKPPKRARQLAREFCDRCPIRQACGEHADQTKALGLWGGFWRTRREAATSSSSYHKTLV